jgi:ketosteroid isomerase-like protein
MATFPREEIEATLADYIATREQIDTKNGKWSDLARFFTDDAVFIDPAHGRVEGIEAITTFLDASMVGLEDWLFPIEFVAVSGNDVAVKWLQVLPNGARQSGWSRMVYAGGGKFRYEEDVLNMAHCMEDLGDIGWMPPEGMKFPPARPDRDFSRPA